MPTYTAWTCTCVVQGTLQYGCHKRCCIIRSHHQIGKLDSHVQMSEEQARSELLSSTQRLRANIDPEKHHIGDQLAGMSLP